MEPHYSSMKSTMRRMPIGPASLPPVNVVPCHMLMYIHSRFFIRACHVSPLQWWHMSLPNWSTCPGHVNSICPITLPHVTSKGCHVSYMKSTTSMPTVLPRHLYGCTAYTISYHMALYGLYNQHFFFLFGKMNRMWYQEHTMYVWACSGCVGFILTIPKHTSILKPF